MAGQKINDHGSWIGQGSGGKVFPDGAKMKSIPHSEGAGAMNDYPDTQEMVHKDQMSGASKIRGRPLKSGYRN